MFNWVKLQCNLLGQKKCEMAIRLSNNFGLLSCLLTVNRKTGIFSSEVAVSGKGMVFHFIAFSSILIIAVSIDNS